MQITCMKGKLYKYAHTHLLIFKKGISCCVLYMELVPKNSTQGVDDAQVNKIPNFHVDILSGYFPVQKYLVMHF